MKANFIFLCGVSLLVISASASAMTVISGGGNVANGGGAKGNTSIRNNDGNSNNNKAPQNGNSNISKPKMPEAAAAPALDTSLFSQVSLSMGLDDQQKKQVDEAKRKVIDMGNTLAKAQSDARAAYEKANTEADVATSGRKVVQTAADIKRFNPLQEFDMAISKILSAAQMKSYRDARK